MAPQMANAKVPHWVEVVGRNNQITAEEPEKKSEITCMALAIYYEARGESARGKRAVGEVMINRTKSGRFPSTVCDVLLQHRQFSFVRNGVVREPTHNGAWTQSIQVASEVTLTRIVSNNWLFFCHCGRNDGTRVGNHIFY